VKPVRRKVRRRATAPAETRTKRPDVAAVAARWRAADGVSVEFVPGLKDLFVSTSAIIETRGGFQHNAVQAVIDQAPRAICDAIADMLEHPTGERSVLALASTPLSIALRRRILHKMLVDTGWNLSRTAEQLGMGNAGNVSRAIRDVGLAHEAARMVRPGRRKVST